MAISKVLAAVVLLGALGACDMTDEIIARNTPSAQGVQLPGGVVLSQSDLIIWNGMSDAQRQRALIFLANGGTVAGSVGAD